MVQLNDKAFDAFMRVHDKQLDARDAEIARLREALRRYGDRARMSFAPPELQETIDTAMAESN